MPKLVASRTQPDTAARQNSAVLPGDLVTEAAKRKQERDIVVMGSVSVVHTLMAHDLVDQYRLMVFPLVLGSGTRLFPDGAAPASLALASAPEVWGQAVRLCYTSR
jgi:dihydrofolate reductase